MCSGRNKEVTSVKYQLLSREGGGGGDGTNWITRIPMRTTDYGSAAGISEFGSCTGRS